MTTGSPLHCARIILFIRSLNRGGAERQLVSLAVALHQRGHAVTVLVFYSDGDLERELHDAGVRVVILEKKGRWDIPRFLLRLVRAIRSERPQVLHSYMPAANVFSALLKPVLSGCRLVWGVRASNMDLSRYDRIGGLLYFMEKRLARVPALIISNSHAGRDHCISRGYPADRIRVISNGISTDRFRPDPSERRRVREEWNVAESELLIGRIGRLDPMKDYPTFLYAAAILSKNMPQARFVCVGEGTAEYRAALSTLATELDLDSRLIWAGLRQDMPSVYNALDLMCSSSAFGEGFPNVIGECMATGVPCVATRGGDSEWILGDLGEIVPPGDAPALAEACNKMFMRDRGEIGRAARKQIVDHFSVEHLVEETEFLLLPLARSLREG